jgi:xylulokinase
VLGRSLLRLTVNEVAVLGAAAIAARGVGLFPSLAAAQQALVRVGPAVMPDPALRGLYDDLFGLYTRAITANASLNADLLGLAKSSENRHAPPDRIFPSPRAGLD